MVDGNNKTFVPVGCIALMFFLFNAYDMSLRETTFKAPSPHFRWQISHMTKESNSSIENKSSWKTIVYVGNWFESIDRFGPLNMTTARCPYTQCTFTKDPIARSYADLVIFAYDKHPKSSSRRGHAAQKYGCANVEPQVNSPKTLSKSCDWFLSFSEDSELPAGYYGHFLPINYTVRPIPGKKIVTSSAAYLGLQRSLTSNASLQSVIGEEKMAFLRNKTKIVAWMSSHCPTISRREILTKQLREYIAVGAYGTCGNRPCLKRSPLDGNCWQKELYKYNFYLSMENTLCPEYLTEKVYLPLVYGLVPVVYGGANYSQYLPPHSYIDASKLGVKALAKLLQNLHNDTRELERYHMWRGFYEVHTGGSLCEICTALHRPDPNAKHWLSSQKMWRKRKTQCRNPPKSFQEPWVI